LHTFGLGAKLGDQHHMSSHQGNLMNYVDGFDMHMWHQMQTALVPDDTRKMLHLVSSRIVQDESGKLYTEVSIITVVPENKCHHLDVTNPSNIEKSQGSTHQSDMNKVNNVNGVGFQTVFRSGQEYDADSSDDDGIVHSGSTDTGQYYEHSDNEEFHNSSHSIGEESHDSLPEEEESESSSGEEEHNHTPVKRSKTTTQIMYKAYLIATRAYAW
jgi:Nuclear protein with HMG-like acidic region